MAAPGVVEHQVVVLGSGGVGKSALTVQFVHFHFVETYDPTIEDAYRRQVVVDGEPVVLSVLDTAGQEEFSAMRSQYLSTGKGFLLCYSIVSQQTFDELKAIQVQVLQAKDADYVPMVLVATKSDLESSRRVSRTAGETLAKDWGCPFLETSARDRLNVEEAFFQVVREIRRVESSGGATEEPKKKATSRNLPFNIPTCTGCVLC